MTTTQTIYKDPNSEGEAKLTDFRSGQFMLALDGALMFETPDELIEFALRLTIATRGVEHAVVRRERKGH